MREPRRDASEHREPLGLVGALGGHLQRAAGQPQALGEVAAEQGDHRHAERVDEQRVDDLRRASSA